MSAGSLNPLERAQFATTSRLISCLVAESLVPAFYWPVFRTDAAGFAVILTTEESAHDGLINRVLCVIPLHHPPIFKDDEPTSLGKKIGLLDPLDMIPVTFVVGVKSVSKEDNPSLISSLLDIFISVTGLQPGAIHKMNDPLVIWHRFAHSRQLDHKIEKEIADEFENSVKWQTHSYEHPPQAPSFTSPSIEWEQSIVEGHPTYPMHKLRGFTPPIPEYAPGDYNFLQPKLRFVSFAREELKITYDFENLVSPLLEAAEARAGRPFNVENARIVIPVHELQIYCIREKFGTAVIYPEDFSLPLLAQQSLRSVVIPGFHGLQLKLALGVKLTSEVRTISQKAAHFNPRFSLQVVPSLTLDHNVVTIAKELASAVHSIPDVKIAKHCAVLVRECHEDHSEERGERLIVCTSLVESGHAGTDGRTPSVIRVFELDTEEKRLKWLEKFVSIFLQAVLPPMLSNGVAFECHPQNCVARFDLQTKELKGFIIHDFGGIQIHPPTLKATTGLDLDDFLLPGGHFVCAKTLDDVYSRTYHTIVHNHFQRLIRVLQLHYNGLGWEVVREQLSRNIPVDHPVYDAWLSPTRRTLPGKAFMVMRIASLISPILHRPVPNLIHYIGTDDN